MSQYRILSDSNAAAHQLENEITCSCREHLAAAAAVREAVKTREEWEICSRKTREIFLSAFPDALWKRSPVKARPVSVFEYENFRIENLIFCSLPGWEVNASVYLPKKPGRYPGVVCPSGHSNKFGSSYIVPPQVFAQNGYAAIAFCPPGSTGELAYRNDHFENGAIGWLTGFWCQTNFVADALSCIDYLETRPDIDMTKGAAMTGVSGGGLTTLFCAALDERIKFFAPVCCIGEQDPLYLKGLYTGCPEQHGKNYLKYGIDFVDILALSAPKKCLLAGGELDGLFDYRVTENLFVKLQKIYDLFDKRSEAELYIEKGVGHAYTMNMAIEVVKRLNAVFRNNDDVIMPQITEIPRKNLECRPCAPVNMFTINSDLAHKLEISRYSREFSSEAIREKLPVLLGLSLPYSLKNSRRDDDPNPREHYLFQDTVIEYDSGYLPGIFLRPDDKKKYGAILYVDDQGKWPSLKTSDISAASGLRNDSIKNKMNVFAVDISGFGELEPRAVSWDLAWWNDIERILTYLSVTNGRCIMGYRVRDVLIALDFLCKQPDVDSSDIILAGRGIGGIAVLMAALLSGNEHRVVVFDILASYKHLCSEYPYDWNQTIIIPDILEYTDIPEIAACLGNKCTVIRPLNALHKPLLLDEAEHVYRCALREGVILYTDNADQNLAAALESSRHS